jgi:hypothetical protein
MMLVLYAIGFFVMACVMQNWNWHPDRHKWHFKLFIAAIWFMFGLSCFGVGLQLSGH